MLADIGTTGVLARVRWKSKDQLHIAIDLRNGGTATVDSTSPFAFSVGDVLLVDADSNSLDLVDPELWPSETKIGVVKLRSETATLLEIGSSLRLIPLDQTVPFEVGNTVEVTEDGTVLRVISPDPISALDVLKLDGSVIQNFKKPVTEGLTFDDFGGYEPVKRRARELVEIPLEFHAQLAKIGARPIKGVLFTGLPGTGKTMLARIIASQSNAVFYQISGPEVFSKWYGQSEELLRMLFKDAAKQDRAIIFFDEIDSVAGQRNDNAHEASKRVVAQLLTLMDGFEPDDNVVVVATTNRPDDIDVALRRPGRFDWEIEFPLPDLADRAAILTASAKSLATVDPLPHDAVAHQTEGWSGADLAAIWSEAALLAVTDKREAIMIEDYLGGVERVAAQRSRLRAARAKVASSS